MTIIEELSALLTPILEEMGYRLYQLNLKQVQKDTHLEVLVEKGNHRLDLNEIVDLSEIISDALDEADLIKQAYILDVGSAGAEKDLRIDELNEYINSYVLVKLKTHVNGAHEIYGDLIEVSPEILKLTTKIKTRTQQVEVAISNIAKIRLAIKF